MTGAQQERSNTEWPSSLSNNEDFYPWSKGASAWSAYFSMLDSRNVDHSSHRTTSTSSSSSSTGSVNLILPSTSTLIEPQPSSSGSSKTSSGQTYSSGTITSPPRTLSTSTLAASANQPGSAASSSVSGYPEHVQPSKEHHGLSRGGLAAAIVVPVVVVLLASLIAAFLLLRRRRRRRRHHGQPKRQGRNHSSALSTSSIASMLRGASNSFSSSEKAKRKPSEDGTDSTNATATAAAIQALAPVVTSAQNRSYFTGLDSVSASASDSSDGSPLSGPSAASSTAPADTNRATHVRSSNSRRGRWLCRSNSSAALGSSAYPDPPPPYQPRQPEMQLQQQGIPFLPELTPGTPIMLFSADDDREAHSRTAALAPLPPAGAPHASAEAADADAGPSGIVPVAAEEEEPAALAAGPFAAPSRPRSRRSLSARSITSTLYSDSASLHSAHATRVSMGAQQVVGVAGSGSGGRESGDERRGEGEAAEGRE